MQKMLIITFCLFAFLLPIARSAANTTLYLLGLCSIYLFYIQKKSVTNLFDKPLIREIVIFSLALVVTIPFSNDIATSAHAFYKEFRYMLPFIVFVVLSQLKDKHSIDGRAILVSYLAGIFIADILAFYQFSVLGMSRVTGLSGNSVIFAFFLETAIPITLALLLSATSTKGKGVYSILFLVNILTILLTKSRGPLIGAAVAVFLILYLLKRHIIKYNKKVIAGVLLITVTILIAAAPIYADRLRTVTDMSYASNNERLLIWQSALAMFKDQPIWGIGLDQFGPLYSGQYISPEAIEKKVSHAHNSYLMVLAESGIIGFLAFGYLLWSIAKFLHAAMIKNRESVYVFTAIGVFCTFIVTGFVDNPVFDPNISRVLWLVLGLVVYEHG